MFECYDKTCYLRTCPAWAPTECYRAECPGRMPEATGKKEYIERAAAVDMFTAAEKEGPGADFPVIKRMLANIPAADVAPVRHGRWLPVMESEITGFNPEFAGCDPVGGYVCSECKTDAELDCNDQFVLSNYCPSCGALMDKEAEHEAN